MKFLMLIIALGLIGCKNSRLEQLYPIELWNESAREVKEVSIKEDGWYTVGVVLLDPSDSFPYEEFSKIIRGQLDEVYPLLNIALTSSKNIVFEGQFNVAGSDGRESFRLDGEVEGGHHKILKTVWLEKGNYKISYHNARSVDKYRLLETYLAIFRHYPKV
jgi:hypothetical protein